MNTHEGGNSPPCDRPSFFGLPPRWRDFSQLRGQWWGGVLFGAAFGFMIGGFLVQDGVMQMHGWFGAAAGLLAAAGLGVAMSAVRRNRQRQQDHPQKA